MKIIYSDLLFPMGHKNFNTENVKALSKISEVLVLLNETYIDMNIPGVNYRTNPAFEKQYGKINIFTNSLKVMHIISKIAKEENVDAVIVSTYDIRIFAIGKSMFKNNSNFYLFSHSNVDLLKNSMYRSLFNTFKNKYNHIVFEDYIAEALANEYKVNKELLHVISHCSYESNKQLRSNDVFDCIALSYSNDENIINKIIEIEKEEKILMRSKKRMLIKSKIRTYDNGYLQVINTRLSDEEYNQLFNSAKIVCLPFSDKYRYRVSGNMIDALSNFKKVLATNFEFATYYKSKYPSIIEIVDEPRSLVEYVSHMNHLVLLTNESDFELFQREHSFEKVISCYKRALEI